ncbi:hypothetical protein, partial [Klebsiella pneumoniae]|uniref:hypothetical protein n=1 Tax=Klebsiella pneumoniae TaxID=573 RepID=UPI002731E50F
MTAYSDKVMPASKPGIWNVVVVSQYLSMKALINIRFAVCFFLAISLQWPTNGPKAPRNTQACALGASFSSKAHMADETPEKVL